MRRARPQGDWTLTLTMLGVAGLGVLARAAVSPDAPSPLLGLFLLLPVMVVAALCLNLRGEGVRWGAGLAAASVAAYCNFVLLDPQYNQDANIGLGLYMIGGFVILLLPAALLGGFIGRLIRPDRDASPAPRASLPQAPWLWALTLPVLGTLANGWAGTVVMRRAREEYPQLERLALGNDWARLLSSALTPLPLLLGVAALPLTLLYRQAGRGGRAQPWLAAWWGTAAGLTGSFLLLGALPRLWEGAFVPFSLMAALPFVTGALGWAWGRRLSHAPTR